MKIPLPLTISSKAKEEIISIYTTKGIPPTYYLRIATKGSGCSGMTTYLGFDEKMDTDLEYELDDLKIIIAKKDVMYLFGITLDFVETAHERGFTFN